MNFLLEAGNGLGSVWIIVLVGLILLTVMGSIRNKKERTARAELVDKLKKGDKIVTYAGVYGEIIEITNTTDGKVVLISTGEGDKVSYMQLHINAIASVDAKQPVIEEETTFVHEPVEDTTIEKAVKADKTVKTDKKEKNALDELEKEKSKTVTADNKTKTKKSTTKK